MPSTLFYMMGGALIAISVGTVAVIVYSRARVKRSSIALEISSLKGRLAGLEDSFISGGVDHSVYVKEKREYSQKLSLLEAQRHERARHLVAYDNYLLDLGILNEKLKNLQRLLRDGVISDGDFDAKTKEMLAEISGLELKMRSETALLDEEDKKIGSTVQRKASRQKRRTNSG